MSFGIVVLPVPLVEKEKTQDFMTNFKLCLEHTFLIQLHALKWFEPFEPSLRGIFQTFQFIVYTL